MRVTIIALSLLVLCTQQKAKRPKEDSNRQTVVIQDEGIEIKPLNAFPVIRGNKKTKHGTDVLSLYQTCEKPTDRLRILVINTKSDATTSQLMRKIAEVLADSAHHVTLLSAGHNVQPLANGVILKEVDYGVKSEALMNTWTDIGVMVRLRAVSRHSQDMLAFCEKVFNRMDIIDWIRAQKFEIAITSGVSCFQSLLRLANIQRSIVVASSEPAQWITSAMGIPSFENPLMKEMTYFQRAKTIISSYLEESVLQNKLIRPLDEMSRRIVGDRYTSMKDAVGRTSLLFVNSDELLTFPRPLAPQWLYIGGINAEKRSSLNPHWNTVLSMRLRSVLVSFGEHPVCNHRMGTLLRAFSEIPDTTFIWKSEGHTSLNQSNIVLSSKLPEKALLADPRVFTIITDGRINVLHDVAVGGKPVVCIPSDQEQLRNCHLLKKKGMALVTSCRHITSGDVKNMIKAAESPEVRNSAKFLSEAIRSRPTSPEERLTRAVEFAARYSSSADIHYGDDHIGVMQRYNLDIFIPLAILLIVVVLLLARIAQTAWDMCKKKPRETDRTGSPEFLSGDEDPAKPSTADPEIERPKVYIDSKEDE